VQCDSCGLVFVPSEFHLAPEQEKLRYAKHTNHKTDAAYVKYLSSVVSDVLSLPVVSPRILDFGSGPEHVLTDILNEQGARCVPHDPLYGITAPQTPGAFDIVVVCEAIEHMRNLPRELACMALLLKPGGFIYIHTQLYDVVDDFVSWWYIIDTTHINFFCRKTMDRAAQMAGRSVIRTNGKNTVVFR